MPIGNVEIVVGAKDVAGDDGGKLAPVLLLIPTVHHIKHPLGVAVSEVTVMWGAIVHLRIDFSIGYNHYDLYKGQFKSLFTSRPEMKSYLP